MTCAPRQRMRESTRHSWLNCWLRCWLKGSPGSKRVTASQAQGANSDRFANAHSRSRAKLRKSCRNPRHARILAVLALSTPHHLLEGAEQAVEGLPIQGQQTDLVARGD